MMQRIWQYPQSSGRQRPKWFEDRTGPVVLFACLFSTWFLKTDLLIIYLVVLVISLTLSTFKSMRQELVRSVDVQTSHMEEEFKVLLKTSPASRKICILFCFRVVDRCELCPEKDFMWFIIADIFLSKLLILLYSMYQKQKLLKTEIWKQNMLRWKGLFQRNCCVSHVIVLIWEVHLNLRSFCAADRKFAQWLLPFTPPLSLSLQADFPHSFWSPFFLPSLHTRFYSSHPLWFFSLTP